MARNKGKINVLREYPLNSMTDLRENILKSYKQIGAISNKQCKNIIANSHSL